MDLNIEDLSIDGNFQQNVSKVFGVKENPLNNPREILEQLNESIKDKTNSTSLYGILLNDSDSFIHGLAKLGGLVNILLVNLLALNHPSNETLNSILHSIKVYTKKNIHPLLVCYYSVITNFECHNYTHLHSFLPFITSLQDPETPPLVLLIVIKYLETDRTKTSEIIQEYLSFFDEDLDMEQFLNYTKILEILFPVIPEIIEPIYLADHTKVAILRKSADIQSGKALSPNERLAIISTLKLINSSCVTEQSRTHNSKAYIALLKVGARIKANSEANIEVRLLSTLAIIKLWNFVSLNKEEGISIDDLAENLVEVLMKDDSESQKIAATGKENTVGNNQSGSTGSSLANAVEGLAYLSLNTPIKTNLRNNEDLISKFITLLCHPQESSLNYGLLVILTNLSKLKDSNADTQDKETLKYLKSMSLPNNSNQKTEKDQLGIQLFNKSLLVDHKIVSVVSKLKVHQGESNLLDLFITLIYMLTLNQDKVVKVELVKQGALNVVLNFLVKTSTVDGNTGRTVPINSQSGSAEIASQSDSRLSSLRALAKMLINVSPTLVFNKYDPKTTLPFLVELLGPDYSKLQQDTYLHEMTLLDHFESLLALTNLSTMESVDLKKLIITRTFEAHLNHFIIDSSNGQVQRAAWELIGNMITVPSLLVKFFNIENDKENRKRLILLVKLLNSRDEQLQIVLANLLVNATSEYDMISQILLTTVKDELLDIIIEIFLDQSNRDLLLRVSYLLLNLVFSGVDLTVFSANLELKIAIANVLKSGDREIGEILIEVIKVVKFA